MFSYIIKRGRKISNPAHWKTVAIERGANNQKSSHILKKTKQNQ